MEAEEAVKDVAGKLTSNEEPQAEGKADALAAMRTPAETAGIYAGISLGRSETD